MRGSMEESSLASVYDGALQLVGRDVRLPSRSGFGRIDRYDRLFVLPTSVVGFRREFR